MALQTVSGATPAPTKMVINGAEYAVTAQSSRPDHLVVTARVAADRRRPAWAGPAVLICAF